MTKVFVEQPRLHWFCSKYINKKLVLVSIMLQPLQISHLKYITNTFNKSYTNKTGLFKNKWLPFSVNTFPFCDWLVALSCLHELQGFLFCPTPYFITCTWHLTCLIQSIIKMLYFFLLCLVYLNSIFMGGLFLVTQHGEKLP